MRVPRVYLALLPLGLSACAVPLTPAPEEFADQDHENCVAWGYQEGTPAYAACRKELHTLHAKRQIWLTVPGPGGGGNGGGDGVEDHRGMDFMCKEAIASGDRGGVRVFC